VIRQIGLLSKHSIITANAPCPKCDGTRRQECRDCCGSGEVEIIDQEGNVTGEKDCEECDGTGKVKCTYCGGTGGTNTWDEIGMSEENFRDNVF
jgi:DnaJ-class molecular chaperone